MTPTGILTLLLLCYGANALTPSTSPPANWNHQYTSVDGSTPVGVSSTCVDLLGNTFAVGWATGNFETHNTAGHSTAFVMKFGSDGTRTFVRFLDSLLDDRAMACQTDASGAVYVVGQTTGYLSTLADPPLSQSTNAFVARFDSTGALLWVRQIQSSYSNMAAAVDVDGSSNAYVLLQPAYSYPYGALTLTKITTAGTIAWSTQFATTNGQTFLGFRQWATPGFNPYNLDYRYSYSSSQDTANYGNPLACDSAGNCYAAFAANAGTVDNTLGPSIGGLDAYITAINPSGVIQWIWVGGSPQDDNVVSLALDSTGNVWIGGQTLGVINQQPIFGGWDAFVMKLTTSAQVLFTRVFGTVQDQSVVCMTSDRQGGMYIVLAQTNGGGSGGSGSDFLDGLSAAFISNQRFGYVLQMDAFGNRLWNNLLIAGYPIDNGGSGILAPGVISATVDGSQVLMGGTYVGIFNEAFTLFPNYASMPKAFVFSLSPQASCNATTFNSVMTEINSLLYTLNV